MKKTAVIMIAVALLGALAFFNKTPTTETATTQSGSSLTQTATTPSSSTSMATAHSKAGDSGTYKDGTYTGSAADTPYGIVQVAAVVSGGKITDIKFLQMPNDQRESMQRTSYAEPQLKQSAINTQSYKIEFVSGATDTSYGFEESLQAALNQANG